MRALADSAPARGSFRVYFIGGATAVDHGWRESTIDADISADNDRIFRGIQKLKESLHLNVELARPEDFVPALAGAASRHLFIDTIGAVSFFHYDPYSQLFSKLVRGFRQDLEDADEGRVQQEVQPGQRHEGHHERKCARERVLPRHRHQGADHGGRGEDPEEGFLHQSSLPGAGSCDRSCSIV